MKDPRQQRDLAVIVKVKPGEHTCLLKRLNKLDSEIGHEGSRFADLTTTHFMRWVLIDPIDPTDPTGTWQLALSTNYDPPRNQHLRELIKVFGDTFHKIYSHCEGYPEAPTTDKLVAYLDANKLKSKAFYVGHACRTQRQIQAEAELREHLQEACDRIDLDTETWAGKSGKEVRQYLRGVAESWIKGSEVGFVPRRGPRAWGRMVLSVLFWGLLALLALPVFGLPILIREYLDRRNGRAEADAKRSFDKAHCTKHLNTLLKREDFVVQNQITHLVSIKKGWSRWVALRITLGLVNGLARYYFNKGKLYGIPSIHFARWCIIDKGTRLLFFSNYDGSWESYLGDFIDQAAKGLTGVWNHTEQFPETRFLVWRGALDEEQFKDWTRAHQINTQVWYSAYRNVSVRNVNHNTALRRGLVMRPTDDQEEDSWASLL